MSFPEIWASNNYFLASWRSITNRNWNHKLPAMFWIGLRAGRCSIYDGNLGLEWHPPTSWTLDRWTPRSFQRPGKSTRLPEESSPKLSFSCTKLTSGLSYHPHDLAWSVSVGPPQHRALQGSECKLSLDKKTRSSTGCYCASAQSVVRNVRSSALRSLWAWWMVTAALRNSPGILSMNRKCFEAVVNATGSVMAVTPNHALVWLGTTGWGTIYVTVPPRITIIGSNLANLPKIELIWRTKAIGAFGYRWMQCHWGRILRNEASV